MTVLRVRRSTDELRQILAGTSTMRLAPLPPDVEELQAENARLRAENARMGAVYNRIPWMLAMRIIHGPDEVLIAACKAAEDTFALLGVPDPAL